MALGLFFNVLFPAVFVFDGAFLSSPTISPLLTTSASTSPKLPDVEIENLSRCSGCFRQTSACLTPEPLWRDQCPCFPNFSALFQEPTWYQPANFFVDITQFFLPAILTGHLSGMRALANATNPVRALNQNETNPRLESLRYGGHKFDSFNSGAHHSVVSSGRHHAATTR